MQREGVLLTCLLSLAGVRTHPTCCRSSWAEPGCFIISLLASWGLLESLSSLRWRKLSQDNENSQRSSASL